MRALVAAFLVLCLAVGCSREDAQARARVAAVRAQTAIVERDSRARNQVVPAEAVRHAQRALAALHEYQGEIHGRLDGVTLNAIEAFQRRVGLEPDGLLTPETQRRLAAAVQASPARDTP